MKTWSKPDAELDVPVRSAFSKRYLQCLKAGLDSATLDSVVYNIVEYQRKNRTVRTDRLEQAKVGGKDTKESRETYVKRIIPVILNDSDAKVLAQLATYKGAHSLDMGDEADAWFAYVTKGGETPVAG